MNSSQRVNSVLQLALKNVAGPLSLATLTTVLSFQALADSTKPECQCRAPGGIMKDLGSIECVDIVGTKQLVRCEMSQNNPYWNNIEGVEGCPALS